ncbi:MAG: GbsR/MarR family transcriptional regulator [Candidatus Krumholzibacteriia bacterium]
MPELSSAEKKFVLHWGEMGARWGVNRTIAQIHALLHLSPGPVTAEEIAGTLFVARSNVSTSLKALQTWNLVNVVHVLGDRRDHFESMKDVWELFRVVLEGRKQREIDPTLIVLRDCLQEVEKSDTPNAYTKQRLEEMLEFFETMTTIYEQIREMPREDVEKLVKLGGKLQKYLAMFG